MVTVGIYLLNIILMPLLSSCALFSGSKTMTAKESELIFGKLVIAEKQINNGDAHKALIMLRNISKKHPKHPEILNMMGLSHLARKNPQAATKYFRKAYDIRKSIAYALNYSSALIEIGSFRKARSILLDAPGIEQYPHTERLYHNIALSYAKEEKLSLAVSYYKKALTQNPSYYLSHYQLGILYQSIGKKIKARVSYDKTTKFCPTCFDSLKRSTQISLSMRQKKRAIQTLRAYMKQNKKKELNLAQAKVLLRKVEKFNPLEKR